MSTIGNVKHVFSGGNTSKGFYSYFDYILSQEEAKRIFCIKGGPGTGKSNFMRRIATEFVNKGYDVELMHCSSDPNSLDGVVIKNIKVALLDGTAPHVVDPKTPGAVDEIINLGEYWEEEEISKHKEEILKINAEISKIFARAYKYIAAAKCIFDDIAVINGEAMNQAGIYFEYQRVMDKEFRNIPFTLKPGRVRKLFASAITPEGVINYLHTIVHSCHNIYVVKGAPGTGTEVLLDRILHEAIARGFYVETYYCPMEPEKRVEHVIIPDLKLAFVTSNKYHQINENGALVIDLNHYLNKNIITQYADNLEYDQTTFDALIDKAVETIKGAKKAHDKLEKFYIGNMRFDEVQKCYEKTMEKILKYAES